MRRMIGGLALVAALTFSGVSIVQAQTAERVYDQGSVWQISFVETKPGMFDDYMAYLNGPWRAIQEAGKQRGDILSYKVLAVNDTRDHEPDVVLMVEFKNMGVFDRSLDDLDKEQNAVFGSSVKSNQAAVSRESVRILRGGFQAREVSFKK
jgi:hypothetical protein